VASGKNAALKVSRFLGYKSITLNKSQEAIEKPGSQSIIKSRSTLENYSKLPVNLRTDFLGIALENPFLLSAAPATDGIDQMRLALKAGWAGGIMKTLLMDLIFIFPMDICILLANLLW